MNYLRRTVIALALALMLIATPALTALAQDDGVGLGCNGLSDSDCTLLQDATLATEALASYSIPAWTVNAYFSAEQETVFVEASGSATIALPEEIVLLRDTFASVETVTPDTLHAFLLQLDANSIQRMLDDLLVAFTVDQFALAAPGEALTAYGAVLYKDRAFYLNLPAPSGENAWFSQPVTLTNADLDEIDEALAELRDAVLEPDIDEAFDAAGGMLVMQQEINALMQRHLTTTRLADDTLDGQPAAVFSSTFNAKDLLSDPDLATTFLAVLENFTAQDPEMEPIEINEAQLQLLLTAVNLLIPEGSLTVNQWVGLDDGYLQRITLDGTLNIDPSLLMPGEETAPEPVVFDLSGAFDLADFNAVSPDDVAVPADYYPAEMLDEFLVGTPEQVEQVLAVGDAVPGSFSLDGSTHIYALPLEAGQTVVLSLESDHYPYLSVYNPDAFLVETHSIFGGEPLAFTADADGVHFVTVEGFSELDYTLTVIEAEG